MTTILNKLDQWPKNIKGEVILTDTENAYFYGNLIYDKPERIKEIERLRKDILAEVAHRRKQKNVNFNLLIGLACRGQFYRECLEEVERLKNKTYQLNQGGH